MNKDFISEHIVKAHSISVSKGFYNEMRPDKERIMLVVSELGEALEAHRKGRFANLVAFKECLKATDINEADKPFYIQSSFESLIKDSMEDEIADAVIRMFDFCGYLDKSLHIITLNSSFDHVCEDELDSDNVGVILFDITKIIVKFGDMIESGLAGEIIGMLYLFSKKMNFDLEEHIKLKMQYNQTREILHGKSY